MPIYLIVFFVVAFLWRSYLVYKRTGINPYVVGKSDRPIDFIEHYYPIPLVIIALTTLVYSFCPSVYPYATPIGWLDNPIVQLVGLLLMLFALAWTAMAQMQMGKSWRIGIDQDNKTELVENGLFKVSRNPIFLGMRIALFGFFLTLPNAFTLVAVVLADILMQIQVRLEEEYLTAQHAEAYREFCGRVRRWI